MPGNQQPTTPPGRTRRMARPVQNDGPEHGNASTSTSPRAPGKLDQIEALLLRPDGASIAEMLAVTGWQAHSLRGAMASALKKRGLAITSAKAGGERRYRASRAA